MRSVSRDFVKERLNLQYTDSVNQNPTSWNYSKKTQRAHGSDFAMLLNVSFPIFFQLKFPVVDHTLEEKDLHSKFPYTDNLNQRRY